MREIIHIQAGSLSNYTGTHYWNTQESYLAYDEDDAVMTDHNISFALGRDNHNQPTLCPRLLTFDEKSNFGALTRDSHQNEAPTNTTTWHGETVLQQHEHIPQSEYHSLLDAEDDNEQAEPIVTNIRYWSDFSRVYFDPKSIQPVPDTPQIAEGDWNASCEAFLRYDVNVELMDGALRRLVEDCNNFQGLQMIQDTTIFGGFINTFLSTFREEHPKAAIVTFACLSSISPLDANLGDSSQIKRILNDTLSLRSLTEFCDLSVPILSPSRWAQNCWLLGHQIDDKSLYQSSAILSAHIETATLPLRLKGGSDNLQTMVAHMNWRKSSPLAVLRGGLCPSSWSTGIPEDIPSLSFGSDERVPFARRDVSRGFSSDEVALYNTWATVHELEKPLFAWHHLPSYPIPTSFPPIFPDARPKATKLISSLTTSPSMGGHISTYAHFVESAARRRDGALLATGLEADEVKELISVLWDIADGYGGTESGDLTEGMGEDET